MVTIMLIAIVMTIATGAFASMARVTANAQSIDLDVRNASNAMNEVSRVLRAATRNPVRETALAAPAVIEARADTVSVYAYVNLENADARPIMVTFAVTDTNDFVESTYDGVQDERGYWDFTGPARTRTLAENVQRTPEQPTFRYLDLAQRTLELETDGALSERNRRQVTAVELQITVDGVDGANNRVGITLQSTAHLSNVHNARS
ncbi:hypothetical protein SAMN06295974_1904 [Plantibacter flavus]|uniref:Uncharacterized protein n=2 Tax=Plantibacter flavus TaxID=150123 RepID=A0A3N2BXN1_9MICO|nr:hypothetical protein EDD42_0041 [Plantibacter flavus]SMG28530.1 hypothetical protein SAMN06295974_1904 [Plantibacter flavus]